MSQVVYPESKESSGPSFWKVLFNSAAKYPQHPSKEERSDINNYIKSIIKRFPCEECVDHSFDYIRSHPIENDNRENLMKYLCGLKNTSNKHEGKPEIDCNDFTMKSINNLQECSTCNIEPVNAPITTIPPPKKVQTYTPLIPSSPIYQGGLGSYVNMNSLLDRYPMIKRSMNLNPSSAYQTQIPPQQAIQVAIPPQQAMPIAQIPGSINELSAKYPSLAGLNLDIDTKDPQEELVGVLKSLDALYTVPSQAMGIPPSQMNLAYTPEMLTNGASLLTQMYLTNAGSMLTTLLSSLTLIGVSVLAKNSIASYDRLFIQNIAGSLLFHTINFLNPRSKDDLMPDLKKLFEGLTKMDVDKIKESLLFSSKDEKSGSSKHATKLMHMLNSKKGIVDMKAIAKNHKDLRGISGHGHGGTGGTLTRDEFDSMVEGGGPLIDGGVNFENIVDAGKYDYMLDDI